MLWLRICQDQRSILKINRKLPVTVKFRFHLCISFKRRFLVFIKNLSIQTDHQIILCPSGRNGFAGIFSGDPVIVQSQWFSVLHLYYGRKRDFCLLPVLHIIPAGRQYPHLLHCLFLSPAGHYTNHCCKNSKHDHKQKQFYLFTSFSLIILHFLTPSYRLLRNACHSYAKLAAIASIDYYYNSFRAKKEELPLFITVVLLLFFFYSSFILLLSCFWLPVFWILSGDQFHYTVRNVSQFLPAYLHIPEVPL